MKKTLIALLALGSVAMAAEHITLTTGVKITPATGAEELVSALTPDYNSFDRNGLDTKNVGSNFAEWPGERKNLPSLSFEVTVGALYGAAVLENADSITLNSFSYMGNGSGWCEDEGRTLTVKVGSTGKSATGELQSIRSGVWLTISNIDLAVTADDVLTITLMPGAGRDTASFSLATADIWGKNDASVAWSGVPSELAGGYTGFNDNWSNEAPLVKAVVTYTSVPEPTTGALSLLALAGLCIRRRK